MAYDEGLAQRVRDLISEHPGFVEKKMFGGIGFMLRGNMACGVNQENLIIRVGPDSYQGALSRPHVEIFGLTGREMKGWIVVKEEGYQYDDDLQDWVDQGVGFALSLPEK